MRERRPPHRLDHPDEWFGEYDWSEPGTAPRNAPGAASEPFDLAGPPGRTPSPGRGLGDLAVTVRTLVVGGVAAVVVLVLIALAAAGVFSSSGSPSRRAATSGTASTTPARPATTRTTPTRTGTGPGRQAPAPAPTVTLKPGDTGAQVRLLQRALARLGYSPGAADGGYGPTTVAAVKRFQTASSLTADGVVGPKTLQALGRALRKG